MNKDTPETWKSIGDLAKAIVDKSGRKTAKPK